jgi:hypothetical protein
MISVVIAGVLSMAILVLKAIQATARYRFYA